MVWLTIVEISILLAFAQIDSSFERKTISLEGQKIKVVLAKTDKERMRGLMFVKDWGDVEGMLFVFEEAGLRKFWMKNTLLPLSIGFFDSDKKLFQVSKLSPAKSLAQKKVDEVFSLKVAKYALEVPQGWFEKQKVKIGASLDF